MSSSQNLESVFSSPQDKEVTAAVIGLMDLVPWGISSSNQMNNLSYNQITVAFDEEQLSLQTKTLIEFESYMRNNKKYINTVIFNIGKEMNMFDEQLTIVSRHIELLKAEDTEDFKNFLEYETCELDNCCKVLSSFEDIGNEFKKISKNLLKEHKTLYKDLKLIIQNPTCAANFEWHFFNQIADLFKLHAGFCNTMAEGYLSYCNMCSELENQSRNKATRQFRYYAERLKKDSEGLKIYADIFYLHKETSNENMIWFADFINKATTVVKNLRDLVVKQIEINRLK